MPNMKILALLILCRIGLCLAQGRIVGGNDALMSDFPFQVSLRNLHFGWSHFCGGSILNEQWILTASHCLDGLGPAMYQVVAGEVNIHDSDETTEFRHVDLQFMHPNYTYTSKEYDIGLIKLKYPLEWSENVQPVLLTDEDISPGTWCNVSGWGTMNEDGLLLSSVLQAVEVPTVDDVECAAAYPTDMKPSMICAGYSGHDSCAADSGGPMVCPVSTGEIRQVGVTAFGIGCGRPGYPGAYTEVSYFLDWIQDVMEQNA